MDAPLSDDTGSGKTRGSGSQSVKAGDRIYQALKGEIYLDLKPGDRLTEQSVSERFGVSRIPVREALQRLVQEGYLRAHLRNGYTVNQISSRTYAELMEVRVVLEGHAVREIACKTSPATAKALDNLASIWSTPNRSLSSHDLNTLNREFHQTLVDLADNRELARLEQATLDRIEVAQRLDFTKPQRISETYREHAAILQALREGHAERAVQILETHIRSSARAVTSIIDHPSS